jgi:hypothetical protein
MGEIKKKLKIQAPFKNPFISAIFVPIKAYPTILLSFQPNLAQRPFNLPVLQ